MNMIRKILDDVSKIHMSQTPRVEQAAREMHLRSATRTQRAFARVGGRINYQSNTDPPELENSPRQHSRARTHTTRMRYKTEK